MKKRFLIAGSAAVALAAVVVACRASIQTGGNVPLVGGSKVEVEIDPLSGDGNVPPQPGLPPGTCIKITFFGANGESLGSTTTEVGEGFDIPEGTEGGRIDPCDPPEQETRKTRRGSGSLHFVANDPRQFGYSYLPFDLLSGPYHYADFWVTAPSRDQADQIADDFILGLLSEPPPFGVQPEGVVEVQMEPDASVRVSMFSTGQPRSLSFEWNGASLYDLDDATVMSQSGWFVTTVVVPSSLVDVDMLGSSDNSFQYRLGLPSGDEVGTSVSVSVTQ